MAMRQLSWVTWMAGFRNSMGRREAGGKTIGTNRGDFTALCPGTLRVGSVLSDSHPGHRNLHGRSVDLQEFAENRWNAGLLCAEMDGGAPEAADVQYHGPGTGAVPETAVLRQFKATASQPKWVAVRRGRDVAVFKVGVEAQTIRSHGLHLPYEPDSVRGTPSLVAAMRVGDHVHLCRHAVCTEEGSNHFQEYGLVPRFNAERFQYAQAEQGAKQTGEAIWNWLKGSGSNVQRLAQRAREFASESEAEEEKLPCGSFSICWETNSGPERLCARTCTAVAQPFSMFLAEDSPEGKTVGLCSEHAAQYLRTRYVEKCSHQDCNRVGFLGPQGFKLCTMHQSAAVAKDETPRAARSRPRSRSRSKSSQVAVAEDPEEVAEAEMEVDDENGGPEDTARNMIREARQEEPVRRPRRSSSHSPGHTPKSAIQRSLAKVGLLDSPGSDGSPTLLQDFFERFAEAKLMGWTEETVRSHLEEKHEMDATNLLSKLITEAEIEQAKGQRGLTRFLQKWREVRRTEERRKAEEERKGRESDWSLIGDGRTTPIETSPETPIPSFPMPPPGLMGTQARVEAKEGTGLRIGAPQVYRPDRKAGAGEETRTPEEPMAQIAKAIQHQTAELATLVRNQQEVSAHPHGTLKGLGKGAEELVFLMRACGQYQIRLGEGEHGQALANALVAAQVGASSKLRAAGFRQKMTQRLAVGLAGGFWGVHERHCLGASEFVAYTDAELDAFSSEAKNQRTQEQRPQNPQRLDEWIVRVKRQTDVWCLVYGEEWRGVKTNAMDLLAEWHMAMPHKWPLTVVMDIWEELHWRFIEEMKELVRQLKKEAARESMTLTEMRFHALLPGPDGQAWLRLPETFNIEKPGTWFQEEVIPRIERKQERLLWNLTWQGGQRKGGPQPAGGDGGAQAVAGASQTDSKPSLKNLWGPKLTPEEVARAKERAPLDRNGTLLCWGNLCRIGCETQSCQRSHEPLRGPFESLDECVRMQLLKRGGLKRMKAETKESVTTKIKELRAHVSKEKGDKIAEGRKGRSQKAGHDDEDKGQERDQQEGGKAGGAEPQRRVRIWDVPEEFQVDYTKAEDLQQVVQGPKESWGDDVFKPERSHGGRDGESATREAKDLVRIAQGLADQPTLKALQGASDDLYAWAAARVAREPHLDVETLMVEMSTFGLGELAKEAAEILEGCEGTRAGEVSRVIVRDTMWAQGQPGQGSVQIDGKVWRLWDYGEDVMMTEELAALLQVTEPVMEKRQCVTVTIAAAVLWRQHGRRPTVAEVHAKAKELRLEQTRLAQEAIQVMGTAAEMVAPVEHELRVYAHDLVTPSHEKDFRSLSVFCLEDMAEARFTVLRADYRGGLVVESVQGQRWEPGGWDVWALIWKGHMTLIQGWAEAWAGTLEGPSQRGMLWKDYPCAMHVVVVGLIHRP